MVTIADNIINTTTHVNTYPIVQHNYVCRKKKQTKTSSNGKAFALSMKVVHTDPQEQVEWIENGGGMKCTEENETAATSENGAAAVASEDADDYCEDISAVGTAVAL